jgi:hypothetical protein
MIANCVARSPGGPIHVLLADQLAEHIPGCNMAFRRSALLEIGGFDPSLRIAGDDVDVCWRIDQRGWTIGFSPAAMVWHHRRNSARAYWRQQFHYGRAEALLERKWPEKYNTLGHPSWAGRVYGKALSPFSFTRSRIYHGTWGSALFQSVYESGRGTLASLPITPEWYLVILILASLSLLGVIWPAMMVMLPLAITAAAIPVLESAAAALHEVRRHGAGGDENLWKRRGLVWWLHLVQPAARLLGRLSSGLTPMRLRTRGNLALPRRRWWAIWSETWKSSHDRLREIESLLSANRTLTLRGGDFDHWDLQVIGGPLGAVRLKMVIEEHGTGRQMVRVAAWPSVSRWAVGAMLTLSAIGTLGLVPGLSAFGVFFAMACGVAPLQRRKLRPRWAHSTRRWRATLPPAARITLSNGSRMCRHGISRSCLTFGGNGARWWSSCV